MLNLFSLTALLTAYAGLLTTIKAAGAFYLLFLAYKAFSSSAKGKSMDTQSVKVDGGFAQYFRRCVFIQMRNPKVVAILSIALDLTAPFWVGGIVALGTGTILIVGHLAYAIAFSTVHMIREYRKA